MALLEGSEATCSATQKTIGYSLLGADVCKANNVLSQAQPQAG